MADAGADPIELGARPGPVRIASIRDGVYAEHEGLDALPSLLADPERTLWIDLASADLAQVTTVTEALRLHPLVAEDIIEGNQRSKIELTDEHIHMVLFILRYGESMTASEVDIVVGKGFLLTVHGATWDPWGTQHLREGVESVLRRGPDHLLWAIVDAIVDAYFPFIDRVVDAIDALEDVVVTRTSPEALQRIFALKRDLITVRRAVAPVREIFNQLTNRDLALIDQEEMVYFRDVYDHLIRLTDEIDSLRELVSGTLEVYLSTVNNNLSVIMKRLTGITVVLAGVGAIGGLFGMSEAGTALSGAEAGGFWTVVILTIAVASGVALWLRRIDWI